MRHEFGRAFESLDTRRGKVVCKFINCRGHGRRSLSKGKPHPSDPANGALQYVESGHLGNIGTIPLQWFRF